VILGTAGHIDHGKTTLVRGLTGVDTDRLPEEKRRGITIELGFAPLVLDGVGTIGVVDVPGHEAFVRTMVAGATGIDLALVVIAADEGIMPQTREHLAILELLGVRQGVVALTKADLVEDDWLALVEEDVREAVQRVLPEARIIATSAQTGRGLDELRAALRDVATRVPARPVDDVFRLPIDRAFTIKGTGTVVTGTVWSGRLTRDEIVRVVPGDRTARVRAIQAHGSQLDAAMAGSRAGVALAGIEVGDVPRGSTIVTDRDWRPTTMVRAEVSLVPAAAAQIRPRTWFRLHVGTTEVGARIVTRDATDAGAFAARVVLDEPLLLRAGDRFVVRTSAPLNTIAGGVVVDPYPPRRGRPFPVGLDLSQRLERMLIESSSDGVPANVLPIRLGIGPAAARDLVRRSEAHVATVGTKLVLRSVLGQMTAGLVADVEAYHAEFPLDSGMPTQLLRSRLKGSPEAVDGALEASIADGRIVSRGGVVARSGWSPTPSAEQTFFFKTLVSQLEAAGAEPPSIEELAAVSGGDPGTALRYLERLGDVVQVEQNRYYTATQLKLILGRLKEAMSGGTEISPSQLRDSMGLSRKYLIPLLEYCDRVGLTSRSGSGRVWRGV
jgi:selenocysteine-specific elongation factor